DPGGLPAHRHPHRLRHHTLRRVHGAARRPAREVLHDVRSAGQQPRHPDGRGARAERRAPSPTGRFHGGAWAPMPLSHSGHAHDEQGLPGETPLALRRRDPLGDLRQSLPLHRLCEHRQGRAARSGQAPGGGARGRRVMTTARTTPEVGGMGHSIKRKEDPRFIRGKGTYVDDVVLPGMLYLDIVRSPHAHAKIVKIDTAKATAVPGVLAVITGADLAKYNLHWMPTLMSDTQMVLPVEKVM